MTRIPAVLAATLLLLPGCSGEEGPGEPSATSDSPTASADDGANGLPECAEVWVVGERLPDGYEGCVEDGEPTKDVVTDCIGKRTLVRHESAAGETTHFVLSGRRIQANSLDGLDEAFLVCLPQDGM